MNVPWGDFSVGKINEFALLSYLESRYRQIFYPAVRIYLGLQLSDMVIELRLYGNTKLQSATGCEPEIKFNQL